MKKTTGQMYWYNFPVINMFPFISYSLILCFFIIFALELYLSSSLSEINNFILISMGSLQKEVIFKNNEFYRTLSSSFLHGSYLHLFFNSLAMYYVGTVLERILGYGHFLFTYLLCCLGSSLFSIYLFDSPNQSVGASGGIMGILGILLIVSFKVPMGKQRKDLHTQFAYYLVPSLIPIIPGIDYTAHWGGAITGVVIGFFYLKAWNKINFKRLLQSALVFISVLTLILTGYLTFLKYPDYSHYQYFSDVLPQDTLRDFDNFTDTQVEDLHKKYPKDPLVLFKIAQIALNEENKQLGSEYLQKALDQDHLLTSFYTPIFKLQILTTSHKIHTILKNQEQLKPLEEQMCTLHLEPSLESFPSTKKRLDELCSTP